MYVGIGRVVPVGFHWRLCVVSLARQLEKQRLSHCRLRHVGLRERCWARTGRVHLCACYLQVVSIRSDGMVAIPGVRIRRVHPKVLDRTGLSLRDMPRVAPLVFPGVDHARICFRWFQRTLVFQCRASRYYWRWRALGDGEILCAT